jgi:hypothetical protein
MNVIIGPQAGKNQNNIKTLLALNIKQESYNYPIESKSIAGFLNRLLLPDYYLSKKRCEAVHRVFEVIRCLSPNRNRTRFLITKNRQRNNVYLQ